MKSQVEDPSFFQLIQWGRDRGAFDDELGRLLLRNYALGVRDAVSTSLIRDRLRPLQVREASGDLPPFKAAKLGHGELVLGTDLFGWTVCLFLMWLVAGVQLVANTGGGKTSLIISLLQQVANCGVAVWMSEFYKTQLRHLRPAFKARNSDLIILRPQDWRWNVLQPQLRNPATHLTIVVDVLMRVLGLPPLARSLLRQGCYDLYRRFGLWHGTQRGAPTLFDLYEWVRNTPGLNESARRSILDRLGSLLLALGRSAAYRQGWNPADLSLRCIDFEMRGASELQKQLLLESILTILFHQEVERGVVNGPLRLVIAFDDSQRLFDARNRPEGEIAPLDELAGVIRSTGISLWAILQTMQGVSPRLTPNLATKIIGRLGSHDDYARLGADLGLTSEQITWAKLHLKPGMFIGQVSEGDWREPFVFAVPPAALAATVDDAAAAESVRVLDALPTVFADEFAHWELHPVAELSTQATAPAPSLSDAELRFLRAVIEHPGEPSGAYAKRARISGQRAAEMRDKFVTMAWLRSHAVSTGGRGRDAIVLEPLAPAVEAVAQAVKGGTI